jgi:tyrosyl-tRNA synthetase
MSGFQSELLRILDERGFIFQGTDMAGLDELAVAGPITGYIGFDATADSLHVGSLIQIMMLRWMQKTGHRPLVLMGGGTTRIGDPSGKDEARQLLTDGDIAQNIAGIKKAFLPFLQFGDGLNDAIMVNNADWLDGLAYIPLLRDVGRHFTINRMLSFDSVKLRLEREQPLTFLEFNYMILQAYDFMELARRHQCRLQLGGSDQWGNIVNGIELTRRVDGVGVFGVTSPLLTTSSGAKMGKSANGAVWLNSDRLSPYEYYQFWRNTEDGDVGRFLALYTELPMDEVRRLGALAGAEINEAKKILAFETTRMLHGDDAAQSAATTAQKTFESGGLGDDVPSFGIGADELNAGIGLIDIMVRSGLSASKSEARRLIEQGGAKINHAVIKNFDHMITTSDLTQDNYIQLTAGKKRHSKIVIGG